MNPIEYKGFTIQPVRPHKKQSFRIYLNEEFKQTCNTEKDAKRLIDFCLKHDVWRV